MIGGRKPKPLALRLLDGGAGHRPLPTEDIDAPGDLSHDQPPSWLNAEQKDCWRHAIASAPPGLLRSLDRALLTVWVVAEQMHCEAARAVEKYGMVIKGRNGVPMRSPYLTIKDKQAEIIARTESALGFSPTSRTRASYAAHSAPKENRFAKNAQAANKSKQS